jgi:hypothetical protein
MNYGNNDLKKKVRLSFSGLLDTIEPKFNTSYWNKVHELTKKIYSDDCDEIEAVKILILIIEELLRGCLEKECTLSDLHYAQEIFNDVDFIYTQGKLYDYYDGELYDIVEYLDHHNNLSDMVKEFKKFKDYFNRFP